MSANEFLNRLTCVGVGAFVWSVWTATCTCVWIVCSRRKTSAAGAQNKATPTAPSTPANRPLPNNFSNSVKSPLPDQKPPVRANPDASATAPGTKAAGASNRQMAPPAANSNEQPAKSTLPKTLDATQPDGKNSATPVTAPGPALSGPSKGTAEKALLDGTQKSSGKKKTKNQKRTSQESQKRRKMSKETTQQGQVFAPEMDVDEDEETLQNVKSLEKDNEPSVAGGDPP